MELIKIDGEYTQYKHLLNFKVVLNKVILSELDNGDYEKCSFIYYKGQIYDPYPFCDTTYEDWDLEEGNFFVTFDFEDITGEDNIYSTSGMSIYDLLNNDIDDDLISMAESNPVSTREMELEFKPYYNYFESYDGDGNYYVNNLKQL